MKIKYYLPRKDAKESNVMMNVSWEGKRLQMSSGLSILTKYWDSKRGRAKNSYSNAIAYNNNLETLITNIVDEYLLKKRNNNSIEKDDIKEIINKFTEPKTVKKSNLLEIYQEFIDYRVESQEYSKRTMQRHRTALNHLLEFGNKTGWKCNFDTMNQDFLLNFKKYLHNKEIRMVDNSIKTIIRTVKTFLKWAKTKGYHNNDSYKDDLTMKEKDTSYIALTIEELKRIENIELSSKRYDEIRDIFLLICYTCLRYSDVHNLDIANFDFQNEMILTNQEKKEELVQLPFHPKLKKLLNKYPNNSFPKISEQKFNQYIKEVFKEAEFFEPFPIYKYYGPNTVRELIPKYKLIASNTARRTFMTLLYKNNVPPKTIMKYSGHKDERSFFRYIKIDDKESEKLIANTWQKMYEN
ncbi:MAG: tyrosine-type recombinase/integrase [bacterium]